MGGAGAAGNDNANAPEKSLTSLPCGGILHVSLEPGLTNQKAFVIDWQISRMSSRSSHGRARAPCACTWLDSAPATRPPARSLGVHSLGRRVYSARIIAASRWSRRSTTLLPGCLHKQNRARRHLDGRHSRYGQIFRQQRTKSGAQVVSVGNCQAESASQTRIALLPKLSRAALASFHARQIDQSLRDSTQLRPALRPQPADPSAANLKLVATLAAGHG